MPENHSALPSTGGPEAAAQAEPLQVIGLRLGEERFIVDIHHVRAIVRGADLEITRVPHSHPYVLGVVNLRGKVVPVVDLALRLGTTATANSSKNRLLVAEFQERTVGFTVEAVSEVLRLPPETIEPPPEGCGAAHVVGVAMVNGQIMSLLDLGRLAADAREGQSHPHVEG